MDRKRMHFVFELAEKTWGSFDDFPIMPPGTDPMPHLSKNTVSQPFYLASDQDQTLIHFTGKAEIWFRSETDERMSLNPSDCVYIPAGVPSRIITHTPSLQVRLKAGTPGREAAIWYCPGCSEFISWQSFRVGDVDQPDHKLPQAAYWEAVQAFNGDESMRTCGQCRAVHPQLDLGDIAWPEVVEALKRGATLAKSPG